LRRLPAKISSVPTTVSKSMRSAYTSAANQRRQGNANEVDRHDCSGLGVAQCTRHAVVRKGCTERNNKDPTPDTVGRCAPDQQCRQDAERSLNYQHPEDDLDRVVCTSQRLRHRY
jgi:hypothetical protein